MAPIKPLYFCGGDEIARRELMRKISGELSYRFKIGIVYQYEAEKLRSFEDMLGEVDSSEAILIKSKDYGIMISKKINSEMLKKMAEIIPLDMIFVESSEEKEEFNVSLSKSCMNEYTIATYLSPSDYDYVLRRVVEFSKILRIYRKLPGINCRMCGYSSCWDFALHAAKGMATSCPVMGKAVIKVGGSTLSLNPFVSRIINSVILSLLKELKSYVPGEVIEIKLYPENENMD